MITNQIVDTLSRTPSFIGYNEGVVTNQIVDTLYPIKTILLRRRS